MIPLNLIPSFVLGYDLLIPDQFIPNKQEILQQIAQEKHMKDYSKKIFPVYYWARTALGLSPDEAAKVTAIAAFESGWGRNLSHRVRNNYFSIKGDNYYRYINGKLVPVKQGIPIEKMKVYDKGYKSVGDFVDWLADHNIPLSLPPKRLVEEMKKNKYFEDKLPKYQKAVNDIYDIHDDEWENLYRRVFKKE